MNRIITTENAKYPRTLHSTKGIETKKQILELGEDQMLRNEDIKTNDGDFAINDNPFLWLIALENVLHTLCKAGCYMVDDPEDARPPDIKAS